jgi:RNase adaptor protein for sRNA GlmZ degradation
MFDVSTLSDPQGQNNLRALNGTAIKIRDWLKKTDKCKQLLHTLELTIVDVESPKAFTKGWVSLGLFDYHGIWIAPAVAELLTEQLDTKYPSFGYVISHMALQGSK